MSVSGSRSSGGIGTVMAAVDDAEFVIADTETDEAWLTMAATDAPDLEGWR